MKLIKVKRKDSAKQIKRGDFSFYLYDGKLGYSLSKIFENNTEIPLKYQTNMNRVFPTEKSAMDYADGLIEKYKEGKIVGSKKIDASSSELLNMMENKLIDIVHYARLFDIAKNEKFDKFDLARIGRLQSVSSELDSIFTKLYKRVLKTLRG